MSTGCCFLDNLSNFICQQMSIFLTLEICPKKIETFFHVNVFMMGGMPYLTYILCMMSIPQKQIHHKYKNLHPDTYFVLYYLHGCCFQLCKYWIPQGRVVRVNLCLSDHTTKSSNTYCKTKQFRSSGSLGLV